MGDKNLNDLLKWGIENSTRHEDNTGPAAPVSRLNEEALKALLGGPSDAELMQAAVENITSTDPEITHESKMNAFDNLEQLIESLDNANLLSKLGLWTPLLELLGHDEAEFRRMAAWCVGTAVQNNEPSQERLVALGGVEKLVQMATGERIGSGKQASDAENTAEQAAQKETKDVRRKAVYALSSAVRNYQPAMDVATTELGKRGHSGEKVDATDMDAIDTIINGLREQANSA